MATAQELMDRLVREFKVREISMSAGTDLPAWTFTARTHGGRECTKTGKTDVETLGRLVAQFEGEQDEVLRIARKIAALYKPDTRLAPYNFIVSLLDLGDELTAALEKRDGKRGY